jgi:murein DD-endopeptidase MepM/ murein hydrolase activator NlpD
MRSRGLEKIRVGELLVQKALITPLQLKQALTVQQATEQKLGKVLVQQKFITQAQLTNVLVEQSLKNLTVSLVLSTGTLMTALPQLAAAQANSNLSSSLKRDGLVGWVRWQIGRTRGDLRAEPSKSATILANLRPGMKVQILHQVTNPSQNQLLWYEIEAHGKRGFIAANMIQILSRDITPLFQAQSVYASPLRDFCHPLQGEGVISQAPNHITTHTGRMKYAFDFAVPLGQPVYAMRPGRVMSLQDRFPDTGGGPENFSKFNYVLIEHDQGYRSAYMHLKQGFKSQVGIKVGDRISAGQLIGYSGNSGWSQGPHLHVEVHQPGRQGSFGQTLAFEIDHLCNAVWTQLDSNQ